MKKEDNAVKESNRIVSSLPLNRRQFLKRLGVLGGGFIFYFTVGDSATLLGANIPDDFNAFLIIQRS
jgi:hypothetical protein